MAVLVCLHPWAYCRERKIHNAASEKLAPDREIFRIFSDFFGVPERFFMFSEVFGPVRTHTDLFGPAQMHSEAFQTRSGMFGKIRKSWIFGDDFSCFWLFFDRRVLLLLVFRVSRTSRGAYYYWGLLLGPAVKVLGERGRSILTLLRGPRGQHKRFRGRGNLF